MSAVSCLGVLLPFCQTCVYVVQGRAQVLRRTAVMQRTCTTFCYQCWRGCCELLCVGATHAHVLRRAELTYNGLEGRGLLYQEAVLLTSGSSSPGAPSPTSAS